MYGGKGASEVEVDHGKMHLPFEEHDYRIRTDDLSSGVVDTFAGGRYTTRTLEKDITLYRAGSSEFEFGQYFSKDKPKGVIQARIDKAILPVWSNGMESVIDTVYTFRVPAGTEVHVGKISSQGGYFVGGTQQIVIENNLWKNLQLIKKESLK